MYKYKYNNTNININMTMDMNIDICLCTGVQKKVTKLLYVKSHGRTRSRSDICSHITNPVT